MAQNTSTAVMQRRSEAHDSLDDFPTPPWATRALVRHVIAPALEVFDPLAHLAKMSVWEPACNRGYMAKPLKEFFGRVHTSDIHDYSGEAQDFCQDRVVDFLWPGSESPVIEKHGLDWIITNPPFRLAEQFLERAFALKPRAGIAVILRTSFLEGIGRHEKLFSINPPTLVAQFAERVPMVRGRLDEEAASATSYCWLVWVMGGGETRLVWIPPCRTALERPDDYPAPEYDAAKDLEGSLFDCYQAVRERVAAGGPAWDPDKPPAPLNIQQRASE